MNICGGLAGDELMEARGGVEREGTVRYRESRLSAHHNYLLGGLPAPGFVLGDPQNPKTFFFLADVVLPGESTPRISARIFDKTGRLLAELRWNRLEKNPLGCARNSTPGGFQLLGAAREPVLEVETQAFANGYLTRLRGRLFDQAGTLCLETAGESLRVVTGSHAILLEPFAGL